jgi:hypothetical protein
MSLKSHTVKKLAQIIPQSVKDEIISKPLVDFAAEFASYAQEGEDRVLLRLLEPLKKSGFYVDVGAHHPVRFSNTYFFYLRNWHGINIDPLPGSMALFNRDRPRDINLELAIASEEQTLNYYMCNEPALNTFSPTLATERNQKTVIT